MFKVLDQVTLIGEVHLINLGFNLGDDEKSVREGFDKLKEGSGVEVGEMLIDMTVIEVGTYQGKPCIHCALSDDPTYWLKKYYQYEPEDGLWYQLFAEEDQHMNYMIGEKIVLRRVN
jgi:hypothetical protein